MRSTAAVLFHPFLSPRPYSLSDSRAFSRPCGGRPAQTSQGERREERGRIRCHIWRSGGAPGGRRSLPAAPCEAGAGRVPVGRGARGCWRLSEQSSSRPAPRCRWHGVRPGSGAAGRARPRPGGTSTAAAPRELFEAARSRHRGPAVHRPTLEGGSGAWPPRFRLSREVGGVLAQFPRLRTGPPARS